MPPKAGPERIVMAYAGGLATTVAIACLKERHGADVIALTLDLGQGGSLTEVRDRALASGAVRAHVLDVREEFARRFVVPALKADALDNDGLPMAHALSSPLIAERLVQIAALEGATAIAHGCDGARHGRHSLEVALAQLDSALEIRPVVRSLAMSFRERLTFARARRLPLPIDVERSSVVRSNLWGREVEWNESGDQKTGAPHDAYVLTRTPSDCPDEPAWINIAFERGVPTAVNGVTMPLVELTSSLAMLAGSHGVGRFERVTVQARRSRPGLIVEAPAGALLHRAHRELQRLASTPEMERFGRAVSREYAAIVRDGSWFSPLREALDAYVDCVQQRVTGVVRLKLLKGEFGVAAPSPADDQVAARSSAPIALPVNQ